MKAYVHNNVYHTRIENITYDFNNIPTADDSQPPIFHFDTAGQFDSGDDSYNEQINSNDDRDDDSDLSETSSDDVYSFEQLMRVEKSVILFLLFYMMTVFYIFMMTVFLPKWKFYKISF